MYNNLLQDLSWHGSFLPWAIPKLDMPASYKCPACIALRYQFYHHTVSKRFSKHHILRMSVPRRTSATQWVWVLLWYFTCGNISASRSHFLSSAEQPKIPVWLKLAGIPTGHLVQPPAQTRPPRASCPGPCPVSCWISKQMDTSQPVCIPCQLDNWNGRGLSHSQTYNVALLWIHRWCLSHSRAQEYCDFLLISMYEAALPANTVVHGHTYP